MNEKTDMLDKEIECVEKGPTCEGKFIFSEGEQRYFKEKGLFEPKRCKSCRKHKKDNTERRPEWQSKKKQSSQDVQGKTEAT